MGVRKGSNEKTFHGHYIMMERKKEDTWYEADGI